MTKRGSGEAAETAERSVLSGILCDPSKLPAAAKMLTPNDFAHGAHAMLFKIMLELDRTEQPVDLVTLSSALQARGKLQAIGGYLGDVAEFEATGANVLVHAKLVRRHALEREEVSLAEALAQATCDEDLDRHRARLGPVWEQLRAGVGRDSAAPVVQTLSEVEPQSVEWLWPGRIPLGKVTVADGDPGLGKSTIALDVAARVSTGRPMPDDAPGITGDVVVLSAEDDPADTIRPRIDAASGDPSRITILQAVRTAEGEERLPGFPLDVSQLEQVVRSRGARLVIIDPLVAFLDSKVDTYNDQRVRQALAALAKLAHETGAAVLGVRHLNKRADANPLYRGGGSIAFIAAARAAFLVAKGPGNPARRVLAPTKMNVAPVPPSLVFEVVERNGTSVIDGLGETDLTAADLLGAGRSGEEPGGGGSAREDAKSALSEVLSQGPMDAEAAKARTREMASCSERTVERAAKVLGVRKRKRGFDGGWEWSLPPKDARGSQNGGAGDLGGLRRPSEPIADLEAAEGREEREGRQPDTVGDGWQGSGDGGDLGDG